MLFTEWNLGDAIEVAKEEEREELLTLLDSGVSVAKIVWNPDDHD